MRLSQYRQIVRVLTTAALASSCAGVEPSGYLKNTPLLSKGHFLDLVYRTPSFNVNRYKTLALHVEPSFNFPSDGFSIKGLNSYLGSNLADRFRETGAFSEVTSNPDTATSPPNNSLICSVAITQMDSGNRTLRWFFGEFGAGHTVIQVEGKMTDVRTGEELMSFIENRRGAAVTDITGGDSQGLLEQDLREISDRIVKEVLFGASGS